MPLSPAQCKKPAALDHFTSRDQVSVKYQENTDCLQVEVQIGKLQGPT